MMQRFNIGRPDRDRIVVDLTHKPHQRLFIPGECRAFQIGQNAAHKLRATEQFRRDRGVGVGSKRAPVEA